MPLKELAISTQIRKSIDSYDNKSPEVAAAKKAVQRGQKTKDQVEAPAVVSYIITKHGNLISDKAELEEFAVDYDPDYYVSHQVVPAAMRILKELDVDEGELEGKGKQREGGRGCEGGRNAAKGGRNAAQGAGDQHADQEEHRFIR